MKVVVIDSMMGRRISALAEAVGDGVEWHSCHSGSPELDEAIADADVLVGSPFTARLAEKAQSLKLIQLTGIGTEGVDFDALGTSVVVANTAHHERSIAEYVLMSMLALSRSLFLSDAALRQGKWRVVRADASLPFPQTLRGRTLGLIGFGHIGQEIVQVIRGLDMEVIAIKRRADPELAHEYGMKFLGGPADLPELVRAADYLVIAAPLTSETRGLIGAEQLRSMKRTAYLINVARGPIVDEAALFSALQDGTIAGAALDTWYRYPSDNSESHPATYPFRDLPNVIMTPHNSGETAETTERRAEDVVANIRALLAGERLRNVVYPAG